MTDKQINKNPTHYDSFTSPAFNHLSPPPPPVQYSTPRPTHSPQTHTSVTHNRLLEFKYDAENCFWQLSIKLEVNTGLLIFYFFAKHIVSAWDYKYLTCYCK